MSSDTNIDIQSQLAARFAQLPKVVQDAILSADVEAHMRELSAKHQLHFDQWAMLENEVMFALLGMQPIEQLAANIEKQVGVEHEVAIALADDVSRIVFAPIRLELVHNTAESLGAQVQNTAPVPPGTPPPPPPEGKAIRTPLSEEYVSNQPSHERKSGESDPYREQIA